MRILALDIGISGGYAKNYGKTKSGKIDCSRHSKQTYGASLDKLYAFLLRVGIKNGTPDLIAHEVLIGRGAGAKLLMGFGAIVELYAFNRKIPVITVPAKSLKKWATGDGDAGKKEMKTRAKKRDDNVADACLLLEYVSELKGLKGKRDEKPS